MAHVHAEAMRLYAEDAAKHDKPWELWEYSMDGGENWYCFNIDNPSFNTQIHYRRKQETIEINGHKVPKPLREDEIEDNTVYYVPYFIDCRNKFLCFNGSYNNLRYYAKKGLLHKTKEAAIAHAEALLSFTEQ
jgi:hypothetical protein